MHGVVSLLGGGTGKKFVNALEGNTFAMRPKGKLGDFASRTERVDKAGVAIKEPCRRFSGYCLGGFDTGGDSVEVIFICFHCFSVLMSSRSDGLNVSPMKTGDRIYYGRTIPTLIQRL